LRKRAAATWLIIVGASTKNPIILCRIADIDQFAVNSNQPSAKEESSRGVGLAERLASAAHQQTQGALA